ncbi:hypothetical protein Esi_0254_0019 [Ectocarpus siliculosus]|uniref:Uncharacterized protein n=1 Tax=Ectocarpus siliculosus TaxID=2880 RepID=D8LJF4_ECTSI|nr:hypothetical protein Esi_0254_0019 [Ectocarpus siliculosus]|eukprot:CBN79487.1 hypothetical protein Esi_0254_0019 [Ectocarpus siliculosus]
MMAATTSSSAAAGATATSSIGTSSPAEIGSSASSSSASASLSDELAPVTSMDAGSFHVVVIIRDSTVNVVKDWGANGKGQIFGVESRSVERMQRTGRRDVNFLPISDSSIGESNVSLHKEK